MNDEADGVNGASTYRSCCDDNRQIHVEEGQSYSKITLLQMLHGLLSNLPYEGALLEHVPVTFFARYSHFCE
ncbi:Hypothetical predicted protein [Octopus vulgaris]|uniref:Uncharacterized protein n=1 Tax=Octopus vulgaris TaxID=6645 RepID=A0AA36EZ99_OCTVU|nr:Hypothetical predicted protein [Octopus vulgaris]